MKIIPIFHHDDGRILLPTARHIWDSLLEDRPEVEQMGTKTGADVEAVFRRLRSEAERQGEDAFHELHARHQQRLKREQEKGHYAFQVRREALNRIGLPEVRQHRLKRLDEEETSLGRRTAQAGTSPARTPAGHSLAGGGGEWLIGETTILKNFQPKISRLTLVADPDGLLTEEGMLSAIRERGFDLIPFDDSIAFRFAYESQYRSLWDQGPETDLVVVLRSAEQQLDKLPFDLLKAGRQLTFALHQLFPKLNYPVIAGLDRSYLDAVDEAYQQHDGDQLTERETKEFVLMHCFSIVPKLIKTPVDLLKMLLSLHARKVRLPDFLIEYLLESLTKDSTFASVAAGRHSAQPGEVSAVPSGRVGSLPCSHRATAAQAKPGSIQSRGRASLHRHVLPGRLADAGRAGERRQVCPLGSRPGVVHDPKADAIRRFRGSAAESSRQKSPAPTHRTGTGSKRPNGGRNWLSCAGSGTRHWTLPTARPGTDCRRKSKTPSASGCCSATARCTTCHTTSSRSWSIRFPASWRSSGHGRNSARSLLLVLDGLAFDQWLLLRKNLEAGDKAWRFQESTAFAWVPTLTSVTRQSIFAGEPPLYFPDSLETTSKEKAHWQRFWEDQGVQRASVDLVTNLDGPTDPKLETALGQSPPVGPGNRLEQGR